MTSVDLFGAILQAVARPKEGASLTHRPPFQHWDEQ